MGRVYGVDRKSHECLELKTKVHFRSSLRCENYQVGVRLKYGNSHKSTLLVVRHDSLVKLKQLLIPWDIRN